MLGARALLGLTVLAVALTALPTTAMATVAASDGITHRIVWDQWLDGRRGIHLRSAAVDGSDVRRVYDTTRGFTLDVSMSHDGSEVAFAPCCQARFPRLTVVDVNDGEVLDPLANHRKDVWSVGGIGFSPDDTHLAFEGTTKAGEDGVGSAAIWTVSLDGSDLQRVLELPWDLDRGPLMNRALVWTDDGILYSDYQDVRLAVPPAEGADDGTSRVVITGAASVRGSGDGLSIVTTRYTDDGGSVWISAPDGTDARRLLRYRTGSHPRSWLRDVAPSYDGQRLIAFREHLGRQPAEVVTWGVDERPSNGVSIELPGAFSLLAWN